MNRLMKYAVVVFAILISICFASLPQVHAAAQPKAILTVKASEQSKLQSQSEIKNFRAVDRAIEHALRRSIEEPPVSDVYLTMEQDGLQVTYLVDSGGDLYDGNTRQMFLLERKMKTILLSYAERLRQDHYGTFIPWEKASALIPNKTVLKVTDLESGLSFVVQKRAGKHHADVQPLTKTDTAVMKKIYSGEWSWNRRAVLVEFGGNRLAASMNGMPHGGDGIPGNNFSGHFCIHFLGSTTHGSGKVDPIHQLMVAKAAGKLKDVLGGDSPYTVAETFFHALNLGERQLLRMCFTHEANEDLAYFLGEQGEIRGVEWHYTGEKHSFSNLLHAVIPYEVKLLRAGGRNERLTYEVHLQRITVMSPWRIEQIEEID